MRERVEQSVIERYLYGGAPADVTAAAGTNGVILRSRDGRWMFRVYGDAGAFVDYEIRHDDLSVTIAADELASFYKIGDERILDHSPRVLGLEKVDG
jgi:hypothetical protein